MTTATVLGVHLLSPDGAPVRIGTLTRDRDGATSFVVSEPYLRDQDRLVFSLSWLVPGDDDATRARLAARGDKIGILGSLPPWFAGLLPEGALRDLVMAEMGPGNHDQFDVLVRLGSDLPGAVLVAPETAVPSSAGAVEMTRLHGIDLARPQQAMIKFSLAGVQLKFAAVAIDGRLTVPARGEEGRCILKVPTEHYPRLPEAEFAAMSLARLIGVHTASCRLVATDAIDGVPHEFLRHGPQALVVDRFDRTEDGRRIHIEDGGQIVGALAERKYTMGTYETLFNMIRRFSTDRHEDLFEAMRRAVADVLIGNGDNHLKNWSFIFPSRGEVRLSPAYDIVPTVLFNPADQLALRFAGTHRFENVTLQRFRRIADHLELDAGRVEAEVRATVRRALEIWPSTAPTLLGDAGAEKLLARLETLSLVQECR
ncbi:type II toxin-antitoxin system HipA family toxin [Neorhizobium sp. NPDC001467]|uniref:type II toxin-antitoxin system HipA family toxin n=1 Tax=Neorhizobium sp. NPDC001467 TaxID=3390595 RepID=UPI003CFEE964